MPFYGGPAKQVYRSQRHGRNVDLILLDQRQYRADQPCGDAVAPPCPEYDQPRPFLGRTQMNWLKRRLSASKATWKVVGSQTMMMPAKVAGGAYYSFDSWQGYPQEREELLAHIKDEGIDDVVFITGDIHMFIAGDVRTELGDGESVAVEFVGGSITSTNFGELDFNAGGGIVIPGNDANPHTDPAIIDALRGVQPVGRPGRLRPPRLRRSSARRGRSSTARSSGWRRSSSRSRKLLPSDGFRYRSERGQKSIKGVNGPS